MFRALEGEPSGGPRLDRLRFENAEMNRSNDVTVIEALRISEISLPLATREFMYVISLKPDAAAGGVPGVGSSEEEVSAYLRRAASSIFSWLNLVPS